MYILIATWGSTRKEYAAMKLTLYLLIGSIVALVGILALYSLRRTRAFDLDPGERTFAQAAVHVQRQHAAGPQGQL